MFGSGSICVVSGSLRHWGLAQVPKTFLGHRSKIMSIIYAVDAGSELKSFRKRQPPRKKLLREKVFSKVGYFPRVLWQKNCFKVRRMSDEFYDK
jgi:hypothetical protein